MASKKKLSPRKTQGEGFIEVTHINKATKDENSIESGVYGFGFKGGNAKLSFSREVPCQLAPYMYMKTLVGIELPVSEDLDSINDAYAFAEKWVDEQIQRTLDEYAGSELKKVAKV